MATFASWPPGAQSASIPGVGIEGWWVGATIPYIHHRNIELAPEGLGPAIHLGKYLTKDALELIAKGDDTC